MLKMSDIAARAGVSSTTVSFVLNDRHVEERISEKTRIKVLQAAEELGYRSNQMARAMRTGNTLMLGTLGGDTSDEVVGSMVSGALQAADEKGYTLKISRGSFGGNAQQVIRRCSELRLMGVIALHLPPTTLADLHTEARQYGFPLVLMDARSNERNIPQVVSDDAAGIDAGVAHLVQLGHRKIAFISGEDMSSISNLRESTFAQAMASHNLNLPENFIEFGSYRNYAPSIKAARILLSLPAEQRPTAIFCSSDLIAMATIQVANSLNLSVPADLSVIGFGDFAFARFSTPPLTTISQPFTEMGSAAVGLLLEIIEKRNQEEIARISRAKLGSARNLSAQTPDAEDRVLDSDSDSSVKVLPTQLIVRESTAPPRA